MVLEHYCGYDAWDLQSIWHSEALSIPPCLIDTSLLWTISGFLWTLFPFAVQSVLNSSRSKRKKLPWTFLLTAKLIIGLCLIVLVGIQFIIIIIDFKHGTNIHPVDYYSPLIKLMTYTLAVGLSLWYRFNGVHTSGLLFIYWFFMFIYESINYLSLIQTSKDPNYYEWSFSLSDKIAKTFHLVGSICMLLLQCFPDSRIPSSLIKENECPYERASFISRILFFWFDSMALKGFRKSLDQTDMWKLAEDNQSITIRKRFDSYIRSSSSPSNHINLLGVLIRNFWLPLLLSAICKLISSLLVFASPQLMDQLLTFIISNQPNWRGYIIALSIFTASIASTIFESQYEFWTNITAMRIRSALITAIYRKSLRLSSLGRRDFTTGEIVNLMSVDTQRIIEYVNVFNYAWTAPIQFALTIYLLWRQLGVSSIAGLVLMAVVMPLNGFVFTKYQKLQTRLMKEKDSRSKLLSDILNGMKVLKLYAWESAFGDIVSSIRKNEIKALKSQALWAAWFIFTFTCAPFFITATNFVTYVLIDKKHVLDANKAFVSISLISILGGPLGFLPIVISHGTSFYVSIKRINKYLDGDELVNDSIDHKPDSITPIVVRDATFSWSPEEEATLKDINIKVEKQKLVAVVGTVGSGKSSLLSALLGDLHKKQGYVNVYGKVAYVPQSAWILNATVRENILFGSSFNQSKYDNVIDSCALTPDLKMLTGGDATEIGEKGINLSGGQKQRISLARAVYANSDIYFFDDPLSAVDSHVAKHLFEKVIGPQGLLKGKTRLLVTHRITFLPQADQIIVMKDGQVRESGTFAELMGRQGEFNDFICHYLAEQKDELDPEDREFIQVLDPEVEKKVLSRSESTVSNGKISEIRKRSSIITDETNKKRSEKKKNSENIESKFKLVETETAEKGSVEWKVYLEYFTAIGIVPCVVLLALYCLGSGLNLRSSFWLTDWSDDSLDPTTYNNTGLRNKRLWVYTTLGISESLIVFIISATINVATVNGARLIHEKMLARLVRAPMSFFDTTPIGRILNRFTADMNTADTLMGFSFSFLISQIFRAIVAVIIICLQTSYLIIVILVVGIVYVMVQKFYIASSRQLRRIESITRSPIYSHFSETVAGSTSIKTYGAVDRFTNRIYHLVDTNHASYFANLTADRWLAIRLEFLGNMIVTLATVFAVLTKGDVSPGKTGLAITYALQITMILSFLVRSVSDVETNIVCIERCLEYTRVDTEAPWINPLYHPTKDWPKEGKITFNKYSTRYRPGLELVLKDVVCTISPNEKVGIVGRTGAGKSSLTLALFRLIEPASGTIVIDGKDLTKLGLHDLRSRLTVIPQDPVLFTGSLRRNLDPFDHKTDQEIFSALEQAHLKEFVDSLDSGLSYEITEGGENLSLGQRQLVCLTRALLRKSKVLILDEATAAVDVETDELIQETIRKEFANCTIVTIAHRLNTIMDYDKIIVMDKGQIVEHDSPNALISDQESLFHSMAKDAKII